MRTGGAAVIGSVSSRGVRMCEDSTSCISNWDPMAALSFGEGTGRLFGSHWRYPVNTGSLT